MALTQNQIDRARALRTAMDAAAATLPDDVALSAITVYRVWTAGITVTAGDRMRHDDSLYRCIQSHTTQSGWTPDATPALWTRVSVEAWPAWTQPTGAQDAYAQGAHVSHDGQRWESQVAGNVWEPGSVGTSGLWTEVT